MVGFKKRLWFMLIVFLVYLSSPGYPKSIKMKNLPASQDMESYSREYDEGELTKEAIECSACKDDMNDTAKCNKCVELNDACPDCCLTDDLEAVRCTEDESEDYECGLSPFGNADNCEPVVCGDQDTNDCFAECKDGSGCESEGTGGEPKSSKTPYGLQRRGCPVEDSKDLAPNDDSCTKVSGSGLDRIWKCPSDGLKPKFADNYLDKSQCLLDSDLTFTHSKPDSTWGYGDYYAVTKVSPACTSSDSCSQSCSGSCEKKKKNCVGQACNPPDCIPKCPDACSYTCVSAACTTPDQSTSDCVCSASQCSTPSCTPSCSSSCGSNGCSSLCASSCFPDSDTYYVYVLSDKYKEYITECIDKADTYEECADRVHCCQKGACPDEVKGKNKKCNSGFEANCDLAHCENRACYSSDCADYTGIENKKSCAQLASDANGCLVDNKNCFMEIDSDFYYNFVAKSGDSLTIIWQIVNEQSNQDVSGVNFYTLVKVFKTEMDKVEPAAHTSMMNVKSLEAAFSIYGTTHVKRGELESGKSYRVRVYYFLPNVKSCNDLCETCAAAENEVELSQMSLTLVRVRE